VDLTDLKDAHIVELAKLTKEGFDLQNMLEAAGDLKYMREIRRAFEEQWETPEEEFVKFFFAKATSGGRFSKTAKEQFTRLVRRTFHQFVSDRVSDRLRTALRVEDVGSEPSVESAAPAVTAAPPTKVASGSEPGAGEGTTVLEEGQDGIVTTAEELEGFRIVRAIVCGVISVDRVTYRDTKSYFGVLVDDNNRKPLCRLHFNGKSRKYLGIFDSEKNEEKHVIDNLADIYRFADQLRAGASRFTETSDSLPGDAAGT